MPVASVVLLLCSGLFVVTLVMNPFEMLLLNPSEVDEANTYESFPLAMRCLIGILLSLVFIPNDLLSKLLAIGMILVSIFSPYEFSEVVPFAVILVCSFYYNYSQSSDALADVPTPSKQASFVKTQAKTPVKTPNIKMKTPRRVETLQKSGSKPESPVVRNAREQAAYDLQLRTQQRISQLRNRKKN